MERTFQDAINEVLKMIADQVAEHGDAEFVAPDNWILLVESSDSNGNLVMSSRLSPRMVSWRARGLLGEAIAEMDRGD
jgi:hypothetical protein